MKEGKKKKRTFRHVSRRPRTIERTKRYPTNGTISSWFSPAYTSSCLHTYIHTYLLSTFLLACVHACDCARRTPLKNWKSSTDSGTKPNNLFSLLRERHDYSSCRKRKDREPTHLPLREKREERERLWLVEWRISVNCTLIITIPQKEIAPT